MTLNSTEQVAEAQLQSLLMHTTMRAPTTSDGRTRLILRPSRRILLGWRKEGCPPPQPHVRQHSRTKILQPLIPVGHPASLEVLNMVLVSFLNCWVAANWVMCLFCFLFLPRDILLFQRDWNHLCNVIFYWGVGDWNLKLMIYKDCMGK